MDTVSVLLYRTSGPQGKVKRRVQDLRIPSSSYLDYLANRPSLDLSHNESARLAGDCLLSRGLEGFHQVLKAEGEVDFLSEPEKRYILENGNRGDAGDDDDDDDVNKELESLTAGSVSSTCREESTESDCTLAEKNQNNMKDVNFRDPVMKESNTEVFFPSDRKVASMKDLVRHVIRKAQQDVAIVMDSFSDVELLCDLLEASRKRNVSVHLLLDHLNLGLFVSMWQDLKLNSKDFPKLSVRSVHGETYCARTGRKLPGQIAESFIMVDWTEVLSGSFSFSWLYWQVHRSFMVLLKGSSVVAPFRQEFYRLYSSSKAVAGFVTFITVPNAACPRSALHTARRNNAVRQRISYPSKAMGRWLDNAAAVTFSQSPTEPEREKPGEAQNLRLKPQVRPAAGRAGRSVPVCVQVQTQGHSRPRTLASNIHSQLAGLAINAADVKNVQECNPPSFQKAAQYQFREKSHQEPRGDGLSLQQRVRNLLAKPFRVTGGVNTSRQWNGSLGFKSKAELSSPSASPHKPSTSSQHSNFVHPRRHMPELQTKPHFQPSYQPHHSSGPSGSRAAPSGPLSTQLHSDARRSHPSPRATMSFQRVPLEQAYDWSPLSQHADRARAMERQSFSSSRGAGQPAWRPLPRSKSMPERRTAGFRSGERHRH